MSTIWGSDAEWAPISVADGAANASISLAPSPTSARAARNFVGGTLRRWGRGDLAEVAVLLTSELVTNAILHARTDDLVVIVRLNGDAARVTVRDEDSTAPRRREPGYDGGRGLVLVDSLSSSWGTIQSAEGKAVWFETRPGPRMGTVGPQG